MSALILILAHEFYALKHVLSHVIEIIPPYPLQQILEKYANWPSENNL
jgi:hypothetical protein